jgi:adenine-specific DNA-methyltransferase
MVPMSPIRKSSKIESPFIMLAEVSEYFRSRLGIDVSEEILNRLLDTFILPVFHSGDNVLLLKNDLHTLDFALSHLHQSDGSSFHGTTLFDLGILTELYPEVNTSITLPADVAKTDPAFFAAVRNLLLSAPQLDKTIENKKIIYPYFSTTVTTSSSPLATYIQKQTDLAGEVERGRSSHFSGSAYYMGSKRHLATFLVEAISHVLPESGIIIDLMCGSGVASGAFNQVWRTIASDAQKFCRILAISQGGGFSKQSAQTLLERILPIAHKHAAELTSRLGDLVAWEEQIIHGSANSNVIDEYSNFIDTLPTYPTGEAFQGWDPVYEVNRRKQKPDIYPWCLFTAYFANVYFGLRQCVEIDSLRYAISTIKNDVEINWALAALIVTLSAQSTTYAAHFAQPLIVTPGEVNGTAIQSRLQKRAPSITHEFTVRLLDLARDSERNSREISDIPGPWANALTAIEQYVIDKSVAVYVDAPYTRDEYSRYYHVLETLVMYNYPSAVGKGKLPDKNRGERFKSEFFTKTRQQVNRSFIDLISAITSRNWICAWSYGNTGDADIVQVTEEVCRQTQCEISSYAVPYEYKAQGGHGRKRVTEYLTIFSPVGR